MLHKISMLLRFFVGLCMLTYGLTSTVNCQTKTEKQREVLTSISYCNLELSENWKLANLSFNSVYSFNLNEKGDVIDIKKIRDDFVGEAKIKSCVSTWKILGVPNKNPFVVSFKWKHGKGWVEQSITGNGFKLIMNVEDISVAKMLLVENDKNKSF